MTIWRPRVRLQLSGDYRGDAKMFASSGSHPVPLGSSKGESKELNCTAQRKKADRAVAQGMRGARWTDFVVPSVEVQDEERLCLTESLSMSDATRTVICRRRTLEATVVPAGGAR